MITTFLLVFAAFNLAAGLMPEADMRRISWFAAFLLILLTVIVNFWPSRLPPSEPIRWNQLK